MSKIIPIFNFNGIAIHQDNIDQMVSLTDMWIAAGRPKNMSPAQWLRLPGTINHIKNLKIQLDKSKDMGKSHISDNIILTKSIRGAGTYAYWEIALWYSHYLNTNLYRSMYMFCIEAYKGNIQIAEYVTQRASEGDQDWIGKRYMGKATRKKFAGILKQHGVHNEGYAQCTNATYLGLFGLTAEEMKHLKANDALVTTESNLEKVQNLRDNMDSGELVKVMFAEETSGIVIKRRNNYGNHQCAETCHSVSQKVAKFIDELNSVLSKIGIKNM